ncbi:MULTISPECIES: acetyl-CoA carboxylase biotin carboxylase subunit [Bacillaceae]|uniref:ATP-grasp domain-containing protein n=1 Tax=Evansella alkalicola TaxID=745819 RepID=A0ABS6JR66_9BACI|nr:MULTISPECIES: biotin carboxylase N-terminal domain-containing protein [Bacillaceae]MBU9720757.1 ATP-grasp domain-containing protein [Bacillus alkalicola]
MISKLLIANRGEIALRIIKTCEKMGITSVAVYSEADKESPYVEMANEAFFIGGPRVNDSYLNMEKIMDVASKAGVDAIHPGYGFLSENPQFARRVEEEGYIFIGPSPHVIEEMGNKVAARKSMALADVPVIPGLTLKDTSETTVKKAAREIGYPIMVKAAAGGGGIGMQKVDHEKDLMNVVSSVVKKSETFFGSGEIYLEKFIVNPRHIEAQLAADKSGNIICLGERDCSIQRRHQKIVEEAPSTFLSDDGRKKLYETAVKAGETIGYTNVGTVEFLVDEYEGIYFLEMNTRLQVEHPVTEETTGVDLVKWQIDLATGKDIPSLQRENAVFNHAIEVRIYAEDPKTFFPSPGKLKEWEFPKLEGIRYDMGVKKGNTVSPFYDPMISKVIAGGNSRKEAVERLIECLEKAKVEGIKTNIPMLITTLKHPVFQKGKATTNFVNESLN